MPVLLKPREDYLSPDLLIEKVQELYFNRQTYIDAMGKSQQMNATKTITELLDGIAEEHMNKRK